MKREIVSYFFRIFFVGSYQRRAFASALGIFIGLLSLGPWGALVAFGISLVFNLNIIAIFVGIIMSLLVPLWHFLALIFPDIYQWIDFINGKTTTSVPIQILISVGYSALFAGLSYPLFLWIYDDRKSESQWTQEKLFVFHDPGKRWLFLKKSIILVCIVVFTTVSIFTVSLFINPEVTPLQLEEEVSIVSIPEKLNTSFKESDEEKETLDKQPFIESRQATTKYTRYAFYSPLDPNAWTKLNSGSIKKIDVLIPEWYSLKPDLTAETQRDYRVDPLANKHKVAIMPMVHNYHKDKWDSELLGKVISSQEHRIKLIEKLLAECQANGYIGVHVHFRNVAQKDKENLVTFMKELSETFHEAKLQVTQAVEVDHPAFDYEELAKIADKLMILMYEPYASTDQQRPLASPDWFQETLEQIPIPAEKRVITLGSFGQDWTVTKKPSATYITFMELMEKINKYQLKVQWDPNSQSPYVRYKQNDVEHVIWFLDGTTFYNHLKHSLQTPLEGIALWRIGTEDDSVWKLFGETKLSSQQAKQLETYEHRIYMLARNEGEIVQLTNPNPTKGQRQIKLNGEEWITEVHYQSYANPVSVDRAGKDPKRIALTFDDGPDPLYTKQIIEVLDRYNVKASFFVIGQEALEDPDIIQELKAKGHEIGNHTYSHPNMLHVSSFREKLELNATQRVIQAFTEHNTNLFRTPYMPFTEPNNERDVQMLARLKQYGYTLIGEKVDPKDWEDPAPDVMVHRILDQLDYGNIVLLHDAGGNRTNTVKALPTIIEQLRAEGYEFATVGELLGKTLEETMPPLSKEERLFLPFIQAFLTTLSWVGNGFVYLLYGILAIGFIRIAFLAYFAFKQRKNMRKRGRELNYLQLQNDYQPKVSVVIAAYNEETVINKTIQSVLQSDYPSLEVIVVNDGSTDRTEEVILKEYGDHPQVRVISKENGGKVTAINVGYREASGEIIVSIDADTIISVNTITMLVRHFQDPRVAAVSGNVKVGNVNNLLTLWQHVEYISGFNLERRAFDELNCIPVVPGAIGAWRKSAIAEVGYYQHDTLAEDTDVTLSLLRYNYKIHYEEKAHAYTEAPEDVKSFLKQRTRWIYGTLQCLWKHRGALFSNEQKGLGFVSLPNMWIFQYGVQTISPFIDILCIFSLLTDQATEILIFYLLFLLFDLLVAFFAFSLEKENSKPLLWLFIQRFAYRQFMTYIVMKSFFYALKGVSVGWNKLARKGNVNVEQASKVVEDYT